MNAKPRSTKSYHYNKPINSGLLIMMTKTNTKMIAFTFCFINWLTAATQQPVNSNNNQPDNSYVFSLSDALIHLHQYGSCPHLDWMRSKNRTTNEQINVQYFEHNCCSIYQNTLVPATVINKIPIWNCLLTSSTHTHYILLECHLFATFVWQGDTHCGHMLCQTVNLGSNLGWWWRWRRGENNERETRKKDKEKKKKEEREFWWEWKLMLVLSLREATTVLTITKGMTVQTRTRGYDGNGGYAGYDGTECNEERYEW